MVSVGANVAHKDLSNLESSRSKKLRNRRRCGPLRWGEVKRGVSRSRIRKYVRKLRLPADLLRLRHLLQGDQRQGLAGACSQLRHHQWPTLAAGALSTMSFTKIAESMAFIQPPALLNGRYTMSSWFPQSEASFIIHTALAMKGSSIVDQTAQTQLWRWMLISPQFFWIRSGTTRKHIDNEYDSQGVVVGAHHAFGMVPGLDFFPLFLIIRIAETYWHKW